MSAPSGLTRAELARLPRELLKGALPLKPDVWKVETPDGPMILKDIHAKPLTIRWFARWLLSREIRVLRHIAGMERVPRVLVVVDRDAVVLSYLHGSPLDKQNFAAAPQAILEQLSARIDELHARGVFHLDLHQRRNLLVDEQSRLAILDFGAALMPGRIGRALLGGLLRWTDAHAVLKFKARFAPELLTRAEARSVLRHGRARRLWPFTPHNPAAQHAARRQLG